MQAVKEREKRRTEAGSALVLWDPEAAHSSREEVDDVLGKTLGARYWRYEVHEMGPDEELSTAIQAAVDEGRDLVAVAGGDDAVRMVASQLEGTGVPLGILPVGATNLLAQELKIPSDLFDAAAILAGDHRLVEVDAMRVGSQDFLLQLGIGPELGDGSSKKPSARRGIDWFSYLRNTVGNLLGRGGTRFSIMVDGKHRRIRARQVVIANAGGMGTARLQWAPGIKPTDGRIDLVALNVRDLADYARLAWQLLREPGDNRPPISCYKISKQAVIVSDEPMPVMADGEVLQYTPLKIEVVPGAVKVVTPGTRTGDYPGFGPRADQDRSSSGAASHGADPVVGPYRSAGYCRVPGGLPDAAPASRELADESHRRCDGGR